MNEDRSHERRMARAGRVRAARLGLAGLVMAGCWLHPALATEGPPPPPPPPREVYPPDPNEPEPAQASPAASPASSGSSAPSGTSAAGSSAGSPPGPAAAAAPATVERGKELFKDNCQKCHGIDMVSPGPPFFDLRTFPHDQKDRFVQSVTHGKRAMPAWGAILKPDEIESLWAYISSYRP